MRTPSFNHAAFNLSAFAAVIAAGHLIYSRPFFNRCFHVPIKRDSQNNKATNLKIHITWKAFGILAAHSLPIALGAFVFKPKCASSVHLYCVTSITHFCLLAMQKHGDKVS